MVGEMDCRKRFFTALNLGIPDRVPFFDIWFNEESILNIGKCFMADLPPLKASIDYSSDEKLKLIEIQIKFTRELDIDAIGTVFFTGRQRVFGTEDLIKDRYGIAYRISPHGEPFPVGGPIRDESDLKSFKAMTPNRDDFWMLKYIRENVPERVMMLAVPGPFRFSWSLLGAMEKLLLNYALNPTLALNLARISTDFVKEVVEKGIMEGAEVICLEGDLASKSNTLMSPAHYRKFIKPYHREICEVAHKNQVPIIKHSDGNIGPILDDLVEAGFDGIHPIQPQCMDIQEVKDHLQGRCCVLGNIDCAYLLPFGSPSEVYENVNQTIKKAAPGGGYILTSSNTIHPACRGENVIAMFKAAKQYGTYPINL